MSQCSQQALADSFVYHIVEVEMRELGKEEETGRGTTCVSVTMEG